MAVNMAYVSKSEFEAKVPKMTTPRNGTVNIALNPEPPKLQTLLIVFRMVAFRGDHCRMKFVKDHNLQENDYVSC